MFEIGASLREARARQGVDVDVMEQRTKVRAKYLRYLEDERFDLLPGTTYTKGFLRVYADALGLDGQLYVDEFNSRFVAGEEEQPLRMRRVEPVRHRRRQQRRESRLVVAGVGVIAVVTALVIAAWKFGGTDTPSVAGLTPKHRATEHRAPKRRAASSSRTQTVRLEVRAKGGSTYMEVWHGSPAGRQLFAGTLERGKTQRFSDTKIYLSVAKPGRVIVTIDGVRYLPFDGELNVSAATAVRG